MCCASQHPSGSTRRLRWLASQPGRPAACSFKLAALGPVPRQCLARPGQYELGDKGLTVVDWAATRLRKALCWARPRRTSVLNPRATAGACTWHTTHTLLSLAVSLKALQA